MGFMVAILKLLPFKLPPHKPQAYKPASKQEQGGGFGDGADII
jgi:hypothetical protein